MRRRAHGRRYGTRPSIGNPLAKIASKRDDSGEATAYRGRILLYASAEPEDHPKSQRIPMMNSKEEVDALAPKVRRHGRDGRNGGDGRRWMPSRPRCAATWEGVRWEGAVVGWRWVGGEGSRRAVRSIRGPPRCPRHTNFGGTPCSQTVVYSRHARDTTSHTLRASGGGVHPPC